METPEARPETLDSTCWYVRLLILNDLVNEVLEFHGRRIFGSFSSGRG